MSLGKIYSLRDAYGTVLLEQSLSAEDQQKLAKIIAELVAGQVKGDKTAIEILNNPDKLQEYLQNPQQPQEIQQEAFFGGNDPQKKYAAFMKNINKILWEMGEDIKTTKDQTNIGNFSKILSGLQKINPDVNPAPSMLQKGMYNVGKVVGGVGKAVATGLVAKSLATVGLPLAVVGAVVGGGAATLKNLANTNLTPQEKLKKALIAAGIGGAIGFAMDHLKTILPDHGAAQQASATSGSLKDPEQLRSGVAEFIKSNPKMASYYDPNSVTTSGNYIVVTAKNGTQSYWKVMDLIKNAEEARDFGGGSGLDQFLANKLK